MADDKRNRRRKSFRDINRDYDFLDKGVDRMEEVREERAREARQRRRERESGRPGEREYRPDIDETQELPVEEIQAQIREMRESSPGGQRAGSPRSGERRNNQRREQRLRKKQRRNRRILFGGGLVILLLVFAIVSYALRKDRQEIKEGEEAPQEEIQEKPTYESGITGQLEKFSRTNKRTILFREPSEKSEQLLNVDKDQYVENYGINDQFTKVTYMGEVGYIANIDLSDIEDEKMFKVSNGFLITNEEYYLPSDYSPGINKDARSAFDIMADAARQEEVNLRIASDFRSFDQQKILFDQTVSEMGEDNAKKLVRAPGHSEAQAGLLFEIMGEDYNTKTSQEFDNTVESRWLKDNAYKYGFVLRHPQNKENVTGMDYQPWTYLYVGVEAAKEMTENNLAYEEFVGLSGMEQQNYYENTESNQKSENADDNQNMNNENTGNNDYQNDQNQNSQNNENNTNQNNQNNENNQNTNQNNENTQNQNNTNNNENDGENWNNSTNEDNNANNSGNNN